MRLLLAGTRRSKTSRKVRTMPETNFGKTLQGQKALYDSRFERGYVEGFDDLFERCRLQSLNYVFKQLTESGFQPQSIFDYGCGQGKFLPIYQQFFPDAKITASDISDVALERAQQRHPAASFISMTDERISLPDASFDLVTSIEVIEHVLDAHATMREIVRLAKPGGWIVLTTPCANRYSLEWTYNFLTGGFKPSHDGYGKFSSEDPEHLRRLKDEHVRALFHEAGAKVDTIYHRAHVFSTIMTSMLVIRRLPLGFRTQIAYLDCTIFKYLTTGANMIAIARCVERRSDAK